MPLNSEGGKSFLVGFCFNDSLFNFWRTKKGLSARSLCVAAFSEVGIFLYVTELMFAPSLESCVEINKYISM